MPGEAGCSDHGGRLDVGVRADRSRGNDHDVTPPFRYVRFWDLLEIGLGGYVVGRGGEKWLQPFFRLKAKK